MTAPDLASVLKTLAQRSTFFDADGEETDEISIDQPDWSGDYPIHIAVAGGDRGALNALIEAGADLNRQGERSMTALHWAAAKGLADLVSTLLEHGARADLLNDVGQTAADLAAMTSNDAVASLIERYAARGD